MEQLTVYVENKQGALSNLLSVISDHSINVRSVTTERANMSEVRLIVDDSEKAKEILEGHDIKSHIVDIVVVELDDKPGELAKITKLLDENDVNIDYMYGIDNSAGQKGLFAIRANVESSRLRDILTDYNLF